MSANFGKRFARSAPQLRAVSVNPKTSGVVWLALLAVGAASFLAYAGLSVERKPKAAFEPKLVGKTKEKIAVRTAKTQSTLVDGPIEPIVNIRTFCSEKWPHDYHMRDHCQDQQSAAEEEADKLDIPDHIGRICAKKWHNDWHMYVYCVRDQTNAATPPAARPTEPTIRIEDHCRRAGPDNYHMREDCENRQYDAKAEMHGRDVDDEIARRCAHDWSSNWVMFKDCVDRQAAAKDRL